ncbi:hypothetical protein D3C86_1520060 [compost metagenome]
MTLQDGTTLEDELAIADAHPLGARPFRRPQYVEKFRSLAEGIISLSEQDRFLELVERLPALSAAEVARLGFVVEPAKLGAEAPRGIFEEGLTK